MVISADRLRMKLAVSAPSLHAVMATGLHSLSLFWVVSLLARYCPPSAVADYVFGFAVCAPIFIFLTLRLRAVLANDTDPQDRTWHFFRFRAATTVLALLLVCGGAVLTLGLSTRSFIVMAVGAVKAAEAMNDICHGGLQRQNAMAAISWSIVIKAICTITLTSIVIPLTGSVLAGVISLLLVWGTAALIDFIRLRQRNVAAPGPIKHAQLYWHTAQQFSALGLTALLVSVSVTTPRYFLAAYAPPNDLGYYGAMAYFSMVVGMVANAVAEVTVPRITRKHGQFLHSAAYLRQVRRLYWPIIALGLLGVLLSLIWGEALLTLFFGAAYAAHMPAFILMQLAGLFMALVFCQTQVIVALGKGRAQLHAAAVAMVLLALACWAWVPQWRIEGAAMADLVFACLYFLLVEAIIRSASTPAPP